MASNPFQIQERKDQLLLERIEDYHIIFTSSKKYFALKARDFILENSPYFMTGQKERRALVVEITLSFHVKNKFLKEKKGLLQLV